MRLAFSLPFLLCFPINVYALLILSWLDDPSDLLFDILAFDIQYPSVALWLSTIHNVNTRHSRHLMITRTRHAHTYLSTHPFCISYIPINPHT
jgi:hypothetical protein